MSTATGDDALDSLIQKLYQHRNRKGHGGFSVDLGRAHKVLKLTDRRVDDAVALYLVLETEKQSHQSSPRHKKGLPRFKDQVQTKIRAPDPGAHYQPDFTGTLIQIEPRPPEEIIVEAHLVEQAPENGGTSSPPLPPPPPSPEGEGDIEEARESTLSNPQSPHLPPNQSLASSQNQPEGIRADDCVQTSRSRNAERRKRHRFALLLIIVGLDILIVVVASLATSLSKDKDGDSGTDVEASIVGKGVDTYPNATDPPTTTKQPPDNRTVAPFSTEPPKVNERTEKPVATEPPHDDPTEPAIATEPPRDDAPVAKDDSVTTPEDTPVDINVVGNDRDPDGNLDAGRVSVEKRPSNGRVDCSAVAGTCTYSPNRNYYGADSFVYKVCDSADPPLCDTATVTVMVMPVNDAPVAEDDSATTPEDTPVDINVVENDRDPDGNLDAGSVSVETGPSNGRVDCSAVAGTCTYTPNRNFSGEDSFVYKVCDSSDPPLCDTETVTIMVMPVNDAPVAKDDLETTPEDTPVEINVVGNDRDLDGNLDAGSVSVETGPSNGRVDCSAVAGTCIYTPNQSFSGEDSFVYKVCDSADPPLCDTATVTVSVTPVNDAPVAKDDSATTPEDTPVDINVVGNDRDPDGNLDAGSVKVKSGPRNGRVDCSAAVGTCTYTPNQSFSGEDSFVYKVCDDADPPLCDSATVTVTVTPHSDPTELPVATESCQCDVKAEQLVIGDPPVSRTTADGIIEPDIEDCGVTWTGDRPGRWFSVCGNGRELKVTTCADDASMNGLFDSMLTVWTGDLQNITSLQCVGGNDDDKFDDRCEKESGLRWDSESNTCYYVQVVPYDKSNTQPLPFGIQVKEIDEVREASPPDCTEAVSLSIGSAPVLGNTAWGRADTSIGLCGGIASKTPGRWFKVRGNGKRLYATTCTSREALNGKFDSLMTVWNGDCPDDLRCVGGNDDYEDLDYDTCDLESLVEWNSRDNDMYYIHVTGFSDRNQRFGIQIEESEDQPSPPKTGGGCFPSDAIVEAKNKGYIPIEEVQLGDKLRSATGFSEVYAFAMRVPGSKYAYHKFTMTSNHTIELSEDHILFIGKRIEPKLAAEVQIGDLITIMPEKELSKVISVDMVKKLGAIHPFTNDGTIIVNGILTSVHSGEEFALVVKGFGHYLINKHQFQQILMAPLRMICRLSREKFCSKDNHFFDDGSHHYLGVVESLQALLLPERVRPDALVFEENFLTVSAFLPFKLLLLFCLVVMTAFEYVVGLRFSLFIGVALAISLVFADHKNFIEEFVSKHQFRVTKKKQE